MAEKKSKSAAKRVREMNRIIRKYGVLMKPTPLKLRQTLEELGPTYVKLGQILSMRPDILPRAYCVELEQLRTGVKPMSFEEITAVIEREQKRPIQELFRRLETVPIGSASIAQVHAATLPNGQRAVVKVQRPHIRETMEQDVRLLKRVFSLLNAVSKLGEVIDLCVVLDEMWAAAQQELDFAVEAEHLRRFSEQNRDIVYVDCPHVVEGLTTSRMLVMEDVGGIQIDDTDALENGGYDRTEIGSKLVDNYMKQVLDDGFFHADPHPGNLRIRDGQIVWLDLGMIGELGEKERGIIGAMIEAVAAGDIMALKSGLLTLGVVKGRVNHPELYDEIDTLMQQYASQSFGSMDLGAILEELIDVAARYGISMPPGISMLGRGIVILEGVLAALCPEINFIQLAANRAKGHAFDWTQISEKLLKSGSIFAHNAQRAVGLPGQLDDLLRMTVKGQTRIHEEVSVQEDTMLRAERAAATLALALVDGALWIAGALLYACAPAPTLLTLPAVGSFVLLGAFGMTVWLLVRVRRKSKKRNDSKR